MTRYAQILSTGTVRARKMLANSYLELLQQFLEKTQGLQEFRGLTTREA